ncbi:hypothetical protein ACB098_01G269500 [Castanea mollissima]
MALASNFSSLILFCFQLIAIKGDYSCTVLPQEYENFVIRGTTAFAVHMYIRTP